jgi:hypothetical protein
VADQAALAEGPLIVLVRSAVTAFAVAFSLGACGGSSLDSTPERQDGSPSSEFESDDLDRAEGASDAVKEYCAGAVSEAQRIGCESHVTDSDLP